MYEKSRFKTLGLLELDDTWLADVDPLESHLECLGIGGNFECRRTVDESVVDQLLETHREVLHPFGSTDADRIGKLLVFFFQEKFSDHGCEGHDLASRNARDTLSNRSQEFLRDDPLHVKRDGVSNRFVELFWEQVQDTTDGRWG